ncbi:hypothetical protein [Acutalibacter intestini]|uniref:hypothetical protein n=1 Tax=Acutalibacter intestini TaxID=3093659 RepID=UPI002AC9E9A0|nr:hypothetical protein [Acutalibacter sp. M00204]
MSKRKLNCTCLKDCHCRNMCTVCFGLGMTISCFCPVGFTLFLSAVILVALGFSLLRQ